LGAYSLRTDQDRGRKAVKRKGPKNRGIEEPSVDNVVVFDKQFGLFALKILELYCLLYEILVRRSTASLSLKAKQLEWKFQTASDFTGT
jgi:hypothetical protein